MRTTSADQVGPPPEGDTGEEPLSPGKPSVVKVDMMAKAQSKTDQLKAFLEGAPPDKSAARLRHDRKVKVSVT